MKKVHINLIFKILIFTFFFSLTCSFSKDYRTVYANPSVNETMSKEEILRKYDELKTKNEKLEEKLLSMDKDITIAKVILGILTAVCGLSLYEIKEKVKKSAEKKINKKVEKEINKKVPIEVGKKIGDEIKRIELMIKNLKRDERLMKESKILVISENNEEENEIKNLLKQFKNVTTIKLHNYQDKLNNFNKYDVIFFNDINGYIQDKDMKDIINKNDNDKAVYFYFNKLNIREPKINKMFKYEGNENINFAKSNATLHGNLLDLMRYQEDIIKNQ